MYTAPSAFNFRRRTGGYTSFSLTYETIECRGLPTVRLFDASLVISSQMRPDIAGEPLERLEVERRGGLDDQPVRSGVHERLQLLSDRSRATADAVGVVAPDRIELVQPSIDRGIGGANDQPERSRHYDLVRATTRFGQISP